MKIVCLMGSPRALGVTSTLTKRFVDKAESMGADVKTYALNNLKYRGCQACYVCKTQLDRCVLKDDLTEVLEETAKADVLVMASPIYFGQVSGQLKSFIDRTFSYLVPDFTRSKNPSRLQPDKSLVFILSQGYDDEEKFSNVYPEYAGFFKWFGFDNSYLIRACGTGDPSDSPEFQEMLEKTDSTVVEIMNK